MQHSLSRTIDFLRRDSGVRFASREYAAQFLSAAARDPAKMAEFRRLLGAEGERLDLPRLADQQVIDLLAGLLAKGCIVAWLDPKIQLAAGHGSRPELPEQPAAPAETMRQPSSRAEVPEAHTWAAGHNHSAQAAALGRAAASGVPFCDI